jgi:uncharacterized protein (DUF1501 family)
MAISRRQFIKRTSLATAGALFGPSLFGNRFVRSVMASTIGNRYFITLFLDGGNDGLNTVIPVSNGTTGTLRNAYTAARKTGNGGLQLSTTDLGSSHCGSDFKTGSILALHPGFRGFQGFDGITAGDGGFKSLFDAGELALIQGCGYPAYSLSHEESRTIWQTANPLGLPANLGKGWVGQALTAGGYTGSDIPAVAIEGTVPPDLSGSSTSVLAIDSLERFDFPYDTDYPSDVAAKRDAFNTLYTLAKPPTEAQAMLQYIGNSGIATLVSAESYPPLHDLYEGDRAGFSSQYDDIGRSTARDFREIAKIIYGVEQGVPNVAARFFELSNGGYDTHSDQGASAQDGQHYQLHAEVAAAVKVFRDDLVQMGQSALQRSDGDLEPHHDHDLASEFCAASSRTTTARSRLAGPDVRHRRQGERRRLYGLTRTSTTRRWTTSNTVYHHTADDHTTRPIFADVYGTLKHWVNVPAGTVASLLPTDTVPVGGDPTEYWTTANFDMTRPGGSLPLIKP